MSEFKYESHTKQVEELINKHINRALEDIGEHMKTEIAEGGHGVTSNNDTGEYAQKTGYKVDKTKHEVIIGNNADYAIYYEFGTGEKSERGGGRGGGWWYQDKKGKFHFTRGSQPSKRMRYTFRDEKSKVQTFMAKELRNIR